MKWGWVIEMAMLLVPIFMLSVVSYMMYWICIDYGLFLFDFMSRPF